MMKFFSALLIIQLWMATSTQAQWLQVPNIPAEPILALFSEGNDLYAAGANRIYHSKDGGTSWSTSAIIHQDEDEITDLVVVDGIIYAAMIQDGCYISTDGGKNWQKNNAGLTGLGATNLSALAVRGDKIYVATIGAGVFVKPLANPLAPWSPFNTNIPWSNVQSLIADGNQLLAGAGANATLSRNSASSATWSEHSFDRFNGQINLFLDATRSGQVLLGAGSQGLYRSTDDGVKWTHFNPGVGLMERVRFANWQGQVVALLTKPNGSFLRSTTDTGQTWLAFPLAPPKNGLGFDLLAQGGKLFYAASNGLWSLSATVAAREPKEPEMSLGQSFPNPTEDGFARIPFSLRKSQAVSLAVIDLEGRVIRKLSLGWLPAGPHEFTIDLNGVAAGMYTYVLRSEDELQVQRMIVLH